LLAKRIRQAILARPLPIDNGSTVALHVSTHGIPVPSNPDSLRDVLASRTVASASALAQPVSRVH
jgi:hypothetical protein